MGRGWQAELHYPHYREGPTRNREELSTNPSKGDEMRPESFATNGIQPVLPSPEMYIGLDEQLRKGIAQQMRVLAELLDPPQQGSS